MGQPKQSWGTQRRRFGRKPKSKSKNKEQAATAAETAERAAAAQAAVDEAAAAAAKALAEAQAAMETPALRPNTAAQEELRRLMIVHKFESLHSPPEEMWDGPGGTVSKIAQWLELPPNKDRRPIRRTLERHVNGDELANHGGGRAQSLTLGESLVAADCLRRGFAEEQAAYMVSAHRANKGKQPVSRTAVRTGFASVEGITRARGTRHQGSALDTVWKDSRLAMVTQFDNQLEPECLAAQRVRRDGREMAPKIDLHPMCVVIYMC
jgi:hypothetical protein